MIGIPLNFIYYVGVSNLWLLEKVNYLLSVLVD